ncbi:phosphatase, partial [Gardnerella vaginalis]
LKGVAITDHDTTAGWSDFKEAANIADFPVIFGSEITSVEGNISVHMLAYRYNPNDECIIEMFDLTRKRRLNRTRKMVELMSHDFPITWQDVLNQAGKGNLTTIGRPHIADALVSAGVFETRSQAFAGPVAPHGPYYIPTPSPNVDEVIKVIKHAGGVSVIAHPADYSRNPVILSDSQIAYYASLGLDGLEVYHRGNSLTQRQRLFGLAKDL